MKDRVIAKPDYDFRVEHDRAKDVEGKFFFTDEESILRCTKGSAIVTINSTVHPFNSGSNFFLCSGMYFKIGECSEDFEMTSCVFSIQFFNEIYVNLDNKVNDVLVYSAPDLYTEEETLCTNLTIDKMWLLNEHKDFAYRHKVIVSLVLCYLYEIYEFTFRKVDGVKTRNSNPMELVMDKFFNLCYAHHMEQHKIDFYADKLNITPRHLSNITRKTLQTTPKELIDYYLAGSAKRLLLSTFLTNQQIADKLHFPDQATFGQFFKRIVGMPPSEFRNKYR